jgi:AcrR family transcriptional regulator
MDTLSSNPDGKSELARERILDAAFAEIRWHGFQAASIATILATTGLTKGALYHYFPSKKDLGLAVVDERVAVVLRVGVFDGLRQGAEQGAPVQALLQALTAAEGWTEQDLRLGCPLNNLMQEMSALDEDFRRHLTDILRAWQGRVADLLRQAQALGQIGAAVDCEAAALFIVAAWEGSVSIAKNYGSHEVFVAALRQLQDYVRRL